MIAVATGRIEGHDMSDIDRFNDAAKRKAEHLTRLLVARHGDGVTSFTTETDTIGGGVRVRVQLVRTDEGPKVPALGLPPGDRPRPLRVGPPSSRDDRLNSGHAPGIDIRT